MKLSKEDELRIKKLIKKLENVKANATELVSLYIPAGADLSTVKNQLISELSLSSNIKSKQTRKAVLSAIEKTINELKKYDKTPENGLIIFSGDVEQKVGKLDTESFVIDNLPVPLTVRIYRTEPRFILDPLKDMIESKNVYGLVSMDKNDAAIAVLKGKSVKILAKLSSLIPGKFRAGGQSAARFSRVRDNLTKQWLIEVSEKINETLGNIENLKGIIVGGPSQMKEAMLKEDRLMPKLKDKIIAVIDQGYAGVEGIKELVNKSQEVLENEEIFQEKKILNEFFTRLSKDDKVAYGVKEVIEAIKMGAVEKVILSESLDEELIEKIEELAKQYNTETIIVSTDTEEGEQLKQIGGIGAFLRYKIY